MKDTFQDKFDEVIDALLAPRKRNLTRKEKHGLEKGGEEAAKYHC